MFDVSYIIDFSGTYNELFGDLLTEALVVTPLIRMANYHSVLPGKLIPSTHF